MHFQSCSPPVSLPPWCCVWQEETQVYHSSRVAFTMGLVYFGMAHCMSLPLGIASHSLTRGFPVQAF